MLIPSKMLSFVFFPLATPLRILFSHQFPPIALSSAPPPLAPQAFYWYSILPCLFICLVFL